MTLPPDIRRIAEDVLTAKQFEAFELECAGWGLVRIGRQLDISKQAVGGRIDLAHRRLRNAGVRQDASGVWYLEREEAA